MVRAAAGPSSPLFRQMDYLLSLDPRVQLRFSVRSPRCSTGAAYMFLLREDDVITKDCFRFGEIDFPFGLLSPFLPPSFSMTRRGRTPFPPSPSSTGPRNLVLLLRSSFSPQSMPDRGSSRRPLPAWEVIETVSVSLSLPPSQRTRP